MHATTPGRRYLDNAATTWPKPDTVLAAWDAAARQLGATAGRAAYREAVEADAIRDQARAAAARLLGGVDPQRVALPAGCTLAINMAIHGLLKPGDHVIATAVDHNATLRPLHWLERRGMISLSIVSCDSVGRVDPAAVAAAWTPATRLVTLSHASNVTGALQDVAAIAAVTHDRGGWLLLDAAQTLGQIPFSLGGCGADIVAAPAHKWLLGTGGTAMLWCREGVEPEPLVQGGTGSASDSLEMPDGFVGRMEAGTPDVPALAALAAAAAWLETRTVAVVGRACRGQAAALAGGLREIPGVRVVAAENGPPIVSFTVEGYAPAEVAAIVEQAAGVQVRAGHHCAARIHDHLGTQQGGTVRASVGPFTEAGDIEALVAAVTALVG